MTDQASDTVEDLLLNERLRLLQPRRGHRAGTDALLLAATARLAVAGLRNPIIADLGAGVGTVGLAAAQLIPSAMVALIERDPAAAALSQRNIVLNALEARVRLAPIDLFLPDARREAGLRETADLVLTNPPFHQEGMVRHSPDAGRRAAHVLAGGTLDDWLRACADVARPGGRIVVVHRADALIPLLLGLEGRFGALTVRPVHPFADAPASRLLVSGVKGSRAPLTMLPPIVLHQRESGFTPLMDAVNCGEGDIAVTS